jgi:SAM-dependent methyltransferase
VDSEPRALYEYYERQSILPTHARFEKQEELQRYIASRRDLFEEKLSLPVRLFSSADVLEFGPDSGENSLAFASWGANLTLVEPNAAALPAIESYFERFTMKDRLVDIVQSDVLGFPGDRQYDFVDAEGFIYTVPTEAWLDVFARVLRPGGWFVVSYYERRGALIELFLRALHAETTRMGRWDASQTAHRLYDAKWASIPHTRSFDSWVMDVLQNPFVRSSEFIDPSLLMSQASSRGFSLYSSWPMYRDGLQVFWHKRRRTTADELEAAQAHLRRSIPSFVAGEKVYVASADRELEVIEQHVAAALDALDEIVLGKGRSDTGLDEALAAFQSAIEQAPVIQDDGGRTRLVETIAALRRASALVAAGALDELCAFTSSDAAFVRAWGMPAHFAVFQYRPA